MKKDKINNIFMLIMFFCLLAYGMLALIRTPKEISYTENRNLNKFQQFTAKGFIDGTYQTGLENAFTDQFVGGGRIKNLMNKNLSFSRYMTNVPALCKDAYISVGNGYYFWNCNEQLVKYPQTNDKKDIMNLEQIAKKYTELNKKIDMYYYYISSPVNYNLTTLEPEIDVQTFMKKHIHGEYKFDYLKFESSEELLDYFYKTDHHWNYKGSYKGYKDIMKLLEVEEIKAPVEEIKFDFEFYGSASRVTSIYEYAENFAVYKFNFGQYDTYIDGNKSYYGAENEYFNGRYNTSKEVNHYGIYYGADYGEVMFDFKQDKKDNLLIIGNSFTNSVNKLIASGFNKTYVIDLRHYENVFNESFNIEKYVKEKEIDKVLILMDITYMTGAEFDMWGDK